MTQDVNVVLFDFKKQRGREMVVENEDGSFTILINSRLSHRGQLEAYHHAMSHIRNRDFEKTEVQTIEVMAHKSEVIEHKTDAAVRKTETADLRTEAAAHEAEAPNCTTKAAAHKTETAAHGIEIPPDAERIPAPEYLERIKAIRRQRRKIQKQLREYEEDMAFLGKMGAGLDTFARGEYHKLYGNDL